MSKILDEYDFEKYEDGAKFEENMTPGNAFVPGYVVIDPFDGKKSLLMQGQTWQTWANTFKSLRGSKDEIHVVNALRFVDGRGFITWYVWDGVSAFHAFARLVAFSGKVFMQVYPSQFDADSNRNSLGEMVCGPLDDQIHKTEVVFRDASVTIRFDDKELSVKLPNPGRVADSLRVRGSSLLTVGGIQQPLLYVKAQKVWTE